MLPVFNTAPSDRKLGASLTPSCCLLSLLDPSYMSQKLQVVMTMVRNHAPQPNQTLVSKYGLYGFQLCDLHLRVISMNRFPITFSQAAVYLALAPPATVLAPLSTRTHFILMNPALYGCPASTHLSTKAVWVFSVCTCLKV